MFGLLSQTILLADVSYMYFEKLIKICSCFFILLAIISPTKNILAQGNVFGTVTNSDASTPVNGDIIILGYLENSDEEIKIESCVGIGYDDGNWYDLLPNYLTASVGDQFNYHFYNIINDEIYNLSGTIDISGFQQENIVLFSSPLPEKPDGLTGKGINGPSVEIDWTSVPGLTYHIYRRDASSNGSFFRIDDPSGSLLNPGVTSGPFTDNTVDGTSTYHYLIIAENGSGEKSPHSDILIQTSVTFMCGDVDNSGSLNILDIVYFINFKYKGGPRPVYIASAEVNGDGGLNILDVVYFINFKYKGGPDLKCPDEFEYP